ncbi:MAG: SH3-like domain-containing protein [Panacagrimonas sp.]
MPALPVEMVDGLIRGGASSRLPEDIAPRFKSGDPVIARNMNPISHTRLPRYIRGKRGVVSRDHGVFCFNDTAAHGLGHKAQHVYSVRFEARELWGESASPRDSIFIDLFDDYLDRVAS